LIIPDVNVHEAQNTLHHLMYRLQLILQEKGSLIEHLLYLCVKSQFSLHTLRLYSFVTRIAIKATTVLKTMETSCTHEDIFSL
jgi:hypothetical protein